MRRLPASFAATVAAAAAFAIATPASAANISAVTSVNVVKPVKLTKLQDIDFGTLTFADFTGSRTIALSRAGAVTCAADIVCSGATRQARFNVSGSNRLTVLLTYSGGTLSNGTDSIPFTADGPATLTMPNSGAQGTNFDVGGSLSVSSALVGGIYTGTMTVTAEYQ